MNAQKALGEGEEEERARYLQEKIIAFVAVFYRIDPAEIKRRTRAVRIVVPRQIAVYLLRELTGLSWPCIGKIFSFDHTTAIHAYQKIKRNRAADARLNNEIQQITNVIQEV